MAEAEYQFGDLVMLVGGEWQGHVGVVSWPISGDSVGHVLIYSDGRIAGPRASYAEVKPANEIASGFSQLAYCLIKLSSYLIERAILPMTR